MPYIRRRVYVADRIEERRYRCTRTGRGIPRSKNKGTTPADVEIINENNARETLRLLIDHNFGAGDMHLTETYQGDQPTLEEAKKNLGGFIRRLRAYYRSIGEELKYIATTEYRGHRIHHHLIINTPKQGANLKKLGKLWGHGRPYITPLDDSGDYHSLGEYLIKEQLIEVDGRCPGKRWSQSRNLKKPKVEKEIIKRGDIMKEPREIVKVKGATYQLKDYKPWYSDRLGCEVLDAVYVRIGLPAQKCGRGQTKQKSLCVRSPTME